MRRKSRKNKQLTIILIIIIVGFSLVFSISITIIPEFMRVAQIKPAEEPVDISKYLYSGFANPLAIYCEELGFKFETRTLPSGYKYSFCIFPDGSECEQKDFFGGHCGLEYSYCSKMGYDNVLVETEDPDFPLQIECWDNGRRLGTIDELMSLWEKATCDNLPSPPPLPKKKGGPTITGLPVEWNWDDYKGKGYSYVTPSEGQGSCGSCWAHAGTGVAESALLLASRSPNTIIDLSEEFSITNCTKDHEYSDCCGGVMSSTYEALTTMGIPDQGCFTKGSGACTCCNSFKCDYTLTKDGFCANTKCSDRCSDWEDRVYKADDYFANYSYGQPALEMKQTIVEKGSISVVITTSGSNLHAISIVGYNDNTKKWIIKNSYGGSLQYYDYGQKSIDIGGFGWVEKEYEPLACGNVLIESTVLEEDLKNCANGLTIIEDGITLDCQGYKIQGMGIGTGLLIDQSQGVTVKNCIVEGFEYGLEFSKADSNYIQDNTFRYNDYGFQMFNGDNNQFSGNSINNNDQGIRFSTDNNIFWNNDFYDNTIYHVKGLYYPQGNKWDYQGVGNYWDDFLSNSGYPSHYDTGAGQDNYPETSCGETLTTSTTLTHDILGCEGNGLIIGANGVALKCRSHKILGSGDYGILFQDISAATVKSCEIQGFKEGIYFDATSTGNTLETNKPCYNEIDIHDKDIQKNTGDQNTCNTQKNWKDTSSSYGCSEICPLTATEGGLPEKPIFQECFFGQKKKCPLQEGVCSGSRETCPKSGNWLGCDKQVYLNHNPKYEVKEVSCTDGEDNDCDGYTDAFDTDCMSDCFCNSCDNCSAKLNDPTCYKVFLENDIIDDYWNCISAKPVNKIFDCQGHVIDGQENGNGISLSSGENVIVKNCEITDFDDGIYTGALETQLINNTIHNNNGPGVYLGGSAENSLVFENLIYENEEGIYLFSMYTNIEKNIIHNNTEDGIHFQSAGYSTLFENILCDNAKSGYSFDVKNYHFPENTGDNNTCNTWHQWKDASVADGCVYTC
jgi:parallel beta-helix repeat protein